MGKTVYYCENQYLVYFSCLFYEILNNLSIHIIIIIRVLTTLQYFFYDVKILNEEVTV